MMVEMLNPFRPDRCYFQSSQKVLQESIFFFILVVFQGSNVLIFHSKNHIHNFFPTLKKQCLTVKLMHLYQNGRPFCCFCNNSLVFYYYYYFFFKFAPEEECAIILSSYQMKGLAILNTFCSIRVYNFLTVLEISRRGYFRGRPLISLLGPFN